MKKSTFFASLVLSAVLLQSGIQAVCAEEQTSPVISSEINPVVDRDGADPFVTRYGDQYLYTKTTGGNISIAIADSIQTLGASSLKAVYKPKDKLKDLWAPEIWNLDGVWYIYFAATVPGEEMHHMYVLMNESENPMEGKWTCEPLAGMDDKFAIDGTIMELNDKRYFLWSGWEGYENVRQDIYLAEMVSPTEVKEEKILLSLPELEWEMHGNPLINEGPEAVVQGNTVNLVYSASGSWTDDYCLGLLTMDAEADPKQPENWTKQETPILSKDQDVYGPGHNCFTVSKDGTEHLNIYHAARWSGAGWTRSIRFGYVTFDENGKMMPMEVTPGDELIKLPCGEQEVTRYPAEAFSLSGEVALTESEEGSCLTGFVKEKDTAEINIYAEEEGDVIAAVLAKVDTSVEGIVARIVIENGEDKESQGVYAGESLQPTYFRLHLNAGENHLKMYSNTGGAEMEIRGIEIRR